MNKSFNDMELNNKKDIQNKRKKDSRHILFLIVLFIVIFLLPSLGYLWMKTIRNHLKDGRIHHPSCDFEDAYKSINVENDGNAYKLFGLGFFYKLGLEGKERSLKKAAEYFSKSCDIALESEKQNKYPEHLCGCFSLAQMYNSNTGGLQKKIEIAEQLYAKVCEIGLSVGCTNLGLLNLKKRDLTEQEKNDNVKLIEDSCNLWDIDACYYLFNLAIIDGSITSTHYSASNIQQILFWSSEKGIPISYYYLGIIADSGYQAVPYYPNQALKWFRLACEEKIYPGCTRLAAMHADGRGVAADWNKAIELYTKACDHWEMDACYALAAVYEQGKPGIPQDKTKAAELYKKACEDGHEGACGRIAQLPADFNDAAALYELACGKDYQLACVSLAAAYQDGLAGKAKDLPKAVSLYDAACGKDEPPACSRLGALYLKGAGIAKDYKKAAELLNKGCAGKDGMGCYNLGSLYEAGWSVKRDRAKAKELYKTACEYGYKEACGGK